MSEFVLSEKNIQKYLEKLNINSQSILSVKYLPGGVINHVFSVKLKDKTLILKQGLESAKSIFNLKLNKERIKNEFTAGVFFKKYSKSAFFTDMQHFDQDFNILIKKDSLEEKDSLSTLLSRGLVDVEVGEKISKELAMIHNKLMHREDIMKSFDNKKTFYQIKINLQCLDITDDKKIREKIEEFIRSYLYHEYTLIHGDLAPKNILITKDKKVIFIDFEEAHYGNPSLDIGYLLAHYYLNAIINNKIFDKYSTLIKRMFEIYISNLSNEIHTTKLEYEKEVSMFIGIFLLSRVDGKAKAPELVNNNDKENVRKIAKSIIVDNIDTIEKINIICKSLLQDGKPIA